MVERPAEEHTSIEQLLRKRSRLRWTLTSLIVLIYSGYALAGLSFYEAYGRQFMNSSLSWGLVAGFGIMALSITFSLLYVKVSNRLQPIEPD